MMKRSGAILKIIFTNKKLKPENGGSKSYLTNAESLILKSHLKRNIYLYVKDICVYVKKAFKKTYRHKRYDKMVTRNNFRYKKPHAVPAKANKEHKKI